jgi:hypothetical protein
LGGSSGGSKLPPGPIDPPVANHDAGPPSVTTHVGSIYDRPMKENRPFVVISQMGAAPPRSGSVPMNGAYWRASVARPSGAMPVTRSSDSRRPQTRRAARAPFDGFERDTATRRPSTGRGVLGVTPSAAVIGCDDGDTTGLGFAFSNVGDGNGDDAAPVAIIEPAVTLQPASTKAKLSAIGNRTPSIFSLSDPIVISDPSA